MPMVEPEVLMDGNHDIQTCYEVTEVVLRSLFDALYNQNVMASAVNLQPFPGVSHRFPAFDARNAPSVTEPSHRTA